MVNPTIIRIYPRPRTIWRLWWFNQHWMLGGGLEHFLFFHIILGIIILTDDIIFFRGVETTNQTCLSFVFLMPTMSFFFPQAAYVWFSPQYLSKWWILERNHYIRHKPTAQIYNGFWKPLMGLWWKDCKVFAHIDCIQVEAIQMWGTLEFKFDCSTLLDLPNNICRII